MLLEHGASGRGQDTEVGFESWGGGGQVVLGLVEPPWERSTDFLLSTAGIPMGFLSRGVTRSMFSELILDQTRGVGKRADERRTSKGGARRLREMLDFKT